MWESDCNLNLRHQTFNHKASEEIVLFFWSFLEIETCVFPGTLETKQQKHEHTANGSTFSCINLYICCSATWHAQLRNEEELGRIDNVTPPKNLKDHRLSTSCCVCERLRAKRAFGWAVTSFYIQLCKPSHSCKASLKGDQRRSLDADRWPMKRRTSMGETALDFLQIEQ